MSLCPCCSNKTYEDCCEAYHNFSQYPETAELLMRSRYSAYVLVLVEYLNKTRHPNCPQRILSKSDFGEIKPISLEIIDTWQGRSRDKVGKVEFIGRFIEKGGEHTLHERSRFKRYEGCWVYLDGEIIKDD